MIYHANDNCNFGSFSVRLYTPTISRKNAFMMGVSVSPKLDYTFSSLF
ncbi:hypothetical protein NMG60_11000711 [Bertholletia excelsa]